jgi:hypothetical protein
MSMHINEEIISIYFFTNALFHGMVYTLVGHIPRMYREDIYKCKHNPLNNW